MRRTPTRRCPSASTACRRPRYVSPRDNRWRMLSANALIPADADIVSIEADRRVFRKRLHQLRQGDRRVADRGRARNDPEVRVRHPRRDQRGPSLQLLFGQLIDVAVRDADVGDLRSEVRRPPQRCSASAPAAPRRSIAARSRIRGASTVNTPCPRPAVGVGATGVTVGPFARTKAGAMLSSVRSVAPAGTETSAS